MVTLRGEQMYEFFDRLVSIALAARKEIFAGFRQRLLTPRQLHDRIREQLIFRKRFQQVDKLRGMNICM